MDTLLVKMRRMHYSVVERYTVGYAFVLFQQFWVLNIR